MHYTPKRKLTKRQRLARERAYYFMHVHSDAFDGILEEEIRRKVPKAWHTLEQDLDVEEPKVKVTLYLDQSVAKVFRAMGKGWQARVNRLLATWVQLKAGELLEMDEIMREIIMEELAKDREERKAEPRPVDPRLWTFRQREEAEAEAALAAESGAEPGAESDAAPKADRSGRGGD